MISVLLIEDDPLYAGLIHTMSSRARKTKYNLRDADTLSKALQLLEEQHYDVILADLGLPDSSGLQTVRSLLHAAKSIPLIVLTGSDSEQMEMEALRQGAQDYLLKPEVSEPLLTRSILNAIDRKKHEETLRQSERRLILALKGSNLVFWDLNVQTGEVIVDERWADMLGYPVSELTSNIDAWRKSLHPDDLSRATAALMDHLEGKRSDYNAEYRIRTRSENWKWIADSGKAYEWDDEGKSLRVAGTHLDITERKTAEKALRDSESRFRLLIENAPDAIYVQTQGVISYVNNTAVRMFGARLPDDLLGRDFMDLIHPDFRENVRERARIVNEEKRAVTAQEQVYLKIDGTPMEVEVSVVPIRYEGHDGALVFTRDISERKEAEKALRESESRFGMLIENAPDGIFVQTQGHFSYLNEAALHLFGAQSPDEMIGQPLLERIHTDFHDHIKERSRLLREEKKSVPYQDQVYLKLDGTPFDVSVGAIPIRFEGHDGALAFVRDITDRKLAEEKLQEAHNRLDQIIEYLPDATFVIDADRNVIAWNRAIEQMTGISKAQMIGKGNYEYALPFYGERRPIIIDLAFLPDEEFEKREYDAVHRFADALYGEVYVPRTYGGVGAYLSATASRLRDASGNVIGAIESVRDVTDRKRAELALRESERQMRALLDNIPDVVWLKDSESGYVAVNEAFGKTCGLKPEQVVGKTDLDIWPKDLAETYRADDREVIQSGRSKRVEEFLEDATGRRTWIETYKTPILNDRGDIIGTTGIARDITERKSVEDLYRMLSDRSLAGVYVVQDGIFKYLNANAASYAGYSPDELVGRDSTALLYHEDQATARKHAGEMLRGVRQSPYEFRIIDKAGQIRWILEAVTTIPYEGKPAVLGNSMDISEFKESQQELEELKAIESSVLAAIPHAVMGARNRHIIFVNEGMENVFGWKREELINNSTRILFRSDEAYESFGTALYATLEKKKTVSGEYDSHFRHKDGKNLICRVTASRIGETLTDQYTTTTIEDVTDLRNIQIQLLQSEKMSSIGQLAAGVAHEINNPTGYVSSNLKTLEEYFDCINSVLSKYEALLGGVKEGLQGKLSPESLSDRADAVEAVKAEIDLSYILNDIPNLIQESRQGTERIRNIVIDLKNFAHPGKAEFELADIVKNIESTLNVVWNELKYKATIHKDYGELPPVMCIPQQLNQVFMNILVNAAHAIKNKGDISIKTRRQDGHVEIAIRDTGCGIPTANISRVFDPFFTTKEVGKGTGLGLNVAYNIVKKHNGKIDVESQVGQGTTFIIKLPVVQSME